MQASDCEPVRQKMIAEQKAKIAALDSPQAEKQADPFAYAEQFNPRHAAKVEAEQRLHDLEGKPRAQPSPSGQDALCREIIEQKIAYPASRNR